MRDFFLLEMNSDLFRKDCFKVGNAFTFKEVRDMAMSEESADKQLQLMNTEVYSINQKTKNVHEIEATNPFRGLPGTEPRRKQTRSLCKIDSDAETNIIPN
ncbi:unnamed protein product [Porites lobata]|uniref:Uncharacterized protein n=1 Tax=Porites lobata TaxID=104759 RepID=A0ABN8RID7_9CNID|nr:unnamed protein product [Porites lobata]